MVNDFAFKGGKSSAFPCRVSLSSANLAVACKIKETVPTENREEGRKDYRWGLCGVKNGGYSPTLPSGHSWRVGGISPILSPAENGFPILFQTSGIQTF